MEPDIKRLEYSLPEKSEEDQLIGKWTDSTRTDTHKLDSRKEDLLISEETGGTRTEHSQADINEDDQLISSETGGMWTEENLKIFWSLDHNLGNFDQSGHRILKLWKSYSGWG